VYAVCRFEFFVNKTDGLETRFYVLSKAHLSMVIQWTKMHCSSTNEQFII
jgi:hypothetical protein